MVDIPQQVSDWLLAEEHPSVAYRTLVEVLGRKKSDPLVKRMKALIPESQDVQRAFRAMRPDGSWKIGKRTSLLKVSTMINYLAELVLDATDDRVDLAVEHLLSGQKGDGDFHKHYSCLNGLFLRALNLIGYGDDGRVQKLKSLLLSSGRHDGGYYCDINPRGRKDRPHHKSCIKGSLKTLLAFSEMPDVWEEEACEALVAYFLDRHVCFRRDGSGVPVNEEITKAGFPFTWKAGLIEAIYALARMGYGKHPELDEAWAYLDEHRTETGVYVLRAGPTLPELRSGSRNKPNKWVTLYAYLSLRHREDGPTREQSTTSCWPRRSALRPTRRGSFWSLGSEGGQAQWISPYVP